MKKHAEIKEDFEKLQDISTKQNIAINEEISKNQGQKELKIDKKVLELDEEANKSLDELKSKYGYKDYSKLVNEKARPKLRGDYTYDELEHIRLQTILMAADKIMARIRSREIGFQNDLWKAFSLIEGIYNIIYSMVFLEKRDIVGLLLQILETWIGKEMDEFRIKKCISVELTRELVRMYRLVLELRQYCGMGIRVRGVPGDVDGEDAFSR